MAQNYRYKPGYKRSVACTNPAAPDSEDPVRLGILTGIATTDEDTDGNTSVDFGPFIAEFSVTATTYNIVAGVTPLYYHDGTPGTLSNVKSPYFFGIALEAITAGSTATIDVFHPPAGGSPEGNVKVTLLAGGAAGDITLTGIASGDELVFVGVFTTAAAIATFADLTSEFTVGTDKISNSGGTATTSNQLMVVWIDRT